MILKQPYYNSHNCYVTTTHHHTNEVLYKCGLALLNVIVDKLLAISKFFINFDQTSKYDFCFSLQICLFRYVSKVLKIQSQNFCYLFIFRCPLFIRKVLKICAYLSTAFALQSKVCCWSQIQMCIKTWFILHINIFIVAICYGI